MERASFLFAREGWLQVAEGAESVSPLEESQRCLTVDASEVESHMANPFAGRRAPRSPWIPHAVSSLLIPDS